MGLPMFPDAVEIRVLLTHRQPVTLQLDLTCRYNFVSQDIVDVLSCTREFTVKGKCAFVEFIDPLIFNDYVDGGWAYITSSSKLYIQMGSEWLKQRYVQV